jgi:hypothetical protein
MSPEQAEAKEVDARSDLSNPWIWLEIYEALEPNDAQELSRLPSSRREAVIHCAAGCGLLIASGRSASSGGADSIGTISASRVSGAISCS